MGLPRNFIHRNFPRNLDDFGLSWTEGLFPSKLTGFLLIVGGISFLIIALFTIRFFFPYLLIGIMIALGFYLIYDVSSISKERQECYQKGKIVYAKVINHNRTFSFYKSKRDYTITVAFLNGNNKKVTKVLTYNHERFWKEYPIGSEVIGLTYENKSFFAEEMGFTFRFYKEK